jgi:protein-S-isoprenylcysteine O-methyltransferase Ste14
MSRPAWWKNARGEWYVVMQTVLFALIGLGPGGIDGQPGLPNTARLAALGFGFLLGGAGLFFAVAGLWRLGDNLSVLPYPKENATLVQGGVYGVARHPIYSGLITGAVGWALIHVSLVTLLYAVLLFVFFDIKSRREERWLIQKFPEYADYRRRVSKLIPFIY